jgi:hypothetical protein
MSVRRIRPWGSDSRSRVSGEPGGIHSPLEGPRCRFE